ncbi:Ig heavy chain Mem5, partial [Pelobates cultripes]
DNQPSPPAVFVLKPQTVGSITACLAKDFYPKDVEIYMNSSQKSVGPVKTNAVLSPEGRYSSVYVEGLGAEDVQCHAKHQGRWVTEQDGVLNQKEEVHFDKNVAAGGTEQKQCVQQTVELPALGSERVNLRSVTVLGMRVLFAKTVAFNLLLSAKFFIM